MKAKYMNVEIEGTPQEIAQFVREMNPSYILQKTYTSSYSLSPSTNPFTHPFIQITCNDEDNKIYSTNVTKEVRFK